MKMANSVASPNNCQGTKYVFLHNVVNKCTPKSKVIPYKGKSDVFMTAKIKVIFTKKPVEQVVIIGR